MNEATPYTPIVSIIGFHHARGPEVEHWIGVDNKNHISEWPLLPFLALADGAHFAEEDFSYFTLKHEAALGPTTLFGVSCTRQLDSSELIDRPVDVTRSTVQKAVVVIAGSPTFFFGHLKQQLSAVTTAWFTQRNFEDLDIIRKFQESLKAPRDSGHGREQYIGLSLRELVYEFRHQTLVLFKCALLQPKMLFFGSRCERLCMTQFSLLSLVPGLLGSLEDCSDPDLNSYESKLIKPTSVKTSDRQSLLKFMGFPLQIFGKGSLFGPYTPLQQLDVLADFGTKSYIVGSTNSLLLQQRDRYSDILVNLDENSINVTSPSLRAALVLSAADRRWIDALVSSVTESWDEADPSRPKTMGFVGSEDYIRLQFEEYVLSMVSSVKYHLFLEKHHGSDQSLFLPDIEGDPAHDFQMDWVDYWKMTENFRIFQKFTDSELFDLVPPKHVMAGGLTIEDVQRRIVQQMKELGVDEKVNRGREVLATTLASGRNNVTTVFNNLSKNVEKFREQRRSQDVTPQNPEAITSPVSEKPSTVEPVATTVTPVLAEASTRAGAYFSSWAAWAGEKKKAFARPPITNPPPEPATDSNAKSLPPDPSKKSFEESIFDARARAAYGGSDSSPVLSPQRAGSGSPFSATAVKGSDGKGIGLGIVNIRPKSPPSVPATEEVVSPGLSKAEPALPGLPVGREGEKGGEQTDIPPPALLKDESKQALQDIEKRGSPTSPLETELSQESGSTIEKVEFSGPEPESAEATQSSLPVLGKESLPTVDAVAPVETDVEMSRPPVPVVEKAAEPPKLVVRKTRAVVEPTQPFSPVAEKTERPLKPGRLVQTLPPGPTTGETEIPRTLERATRSSVPTTEETEETEVPRTLDRATRRSVPAFDKTMNPPKSEKVAPEPVKIPDYPRATPVEVVSARAKSPEPVRMGKYLRDEPAAIPTTEPIAKPLRYTKTESTTIGLKTSGESLKTARHMRNEPTISPTTEPILRPTRHARNESGSNSPIRDIMKPIRHTRPELRGINSDNNVLRSMGHTKTESGSMSPDNEPVLRPIRHARTESGSMNSDKDSILRSMGHIRTGSERASPEKEPILRPIGRTRTESGSVSPDKEPVLRSIGHTRTELGRMSPDKQNPKPERIKGSIAERAKRFSQPEDPSDKAPKSTFAARRAMFEKK